MFRTQNTIITKMPEIDDPVELEMGLLDPTLFVHVKVISLNPLKGIVCNKGNQEKLKGDDEVYFSKENIVASAFRDRVDRFYQAISKLADSQHRSEAIAAINGVLGNHLKSAITIKHIDNKDIKHEFIWLLISALESQYGKDEDKLERFLTDIQNSEGALSENNPLKTYKFIDLPKINK